MKVKVRIIQPPYTDVPTESLKAILRNHAHHRLHVRVSLQQLFDIMEVLANRYDASGYCQKTAEEFFDEFCQHYLPRKIIRRLHIDCLCG